MGRTLGATECMTWNDRRKGWFRRNSNRVEPMPIAEPPTTDQPLTIPPYPTFSPAAIAQLLQVYRSNVTYWIQSGKIDSFQDNIGETYVLREELIRFVREFVGREIKNP